MGNLGNAEPVTRSNQEKRYRSSALGLAYEGSTMNSTTIAYTRLPDGEVVGTRTGTDRTYFITDHLGSVVGLYTGHIGGHIGGYSYSPYSEARSTASNTTAQNNPIRYISGYWDAPSGLYKLGARFYATTIARFTQMDPSGQETNPFAYSEGNPSSALGLSYEGSTSNSTATAFSRLPDGEIVGTRTGSARSYFVTDILGSVVGIYNGQFAGYLGGYSYSPYGEARSVASNTVVQSNPIRYIGGYWDAPSGLYKLGARFYDATIARFTQMDPSGQEASPYAYTAGDPINSSDPSGLRSRGGAETFDLVLGFIGWTSMAKAIASGDARQIAAEVTEILISTVATGLCVGIAAGLTAGIGAVGALACQIVGEAVAFATVGVWV